MEFLKRHKFKSLFIALAAIATLAYAAGFERIPKDTLILGTGSSSSKTFEGDVGLATNNPKIRFNSTSPNLEFASDGVSFLPFGSGSGGAVGINVISNGDFELGVASDWTASGGTGTDETGANLINGSKSLSYTASAAADTYTSSQSSLQLAVDDQTCLAFFRYHGSGSTYSAEVIDSGSNVLGAKKLIDRTKVKEEYIPFKCPTSTTIAFRLVASAGASTIYLDDVSAGVRDRVRKSLELVSVDDPNAVISGGGLVLADGKVLKTYDGAGTASTDYGESLTINLTTVLGGAPTAATTYSLCIDKNTLVAPTVLSDTGEEVVSLIEGNFSLLTDSLSNIDRARYICLAYIRSNESGTDWANANGYFDDYPRANESMYPLAVSPISYSSGKTVVGSVGSVGQIAAGHVLTDASFPVAVSGTVSYYNLTDVNDDSGNAKNFTNTGVTFDGLDINGGSTTANFTGTNHLTNTDLFFNPGDLDFTTGFFIYPDEIGDGFAISQYGGVGQFSFGIVFIGGTNSISFRASPDGTAIEQCSIPQPGISKYQHLAFRYIAATNEITGFVNGIAACSFILSTNIHQSVSSNFYVSTLDGTTDPMLMKMDELFFGQTALSDDDIKKLYSYRAQHNKNVATENQNWSSIWERSDSKITAQLENGYISAIDANNIYWDFSDLDPASSVTVKMSNTATNATIIPTKTFDTGVISSAPSFPLSHGLSDTPVEVTVMTEGQSIASQWDYRKDLCSSSNSVLNCDLSGLTIDGTHRLRILASLTPGGSAIKPASTTELGTVYKEKTQFSTYAGINGSGTEASALKIFSNLVSGVTYRVDFGSENFRRAANGHYTKMDLRQNSAVITYAGLTDSGSFVEVVENQANSNFYVFTYNGTDTWDINVRVLGTGSAIGAYYIQITEMKNYESVSNILP